VRFLLACEVSPPSAFGLPDGDTLVMPAPGGHFQGPSVHSRAGVRVAPGTLSQYRLLESRFQVECTAGTSQVRFIDNVVELRFEADSRVTALAEGVRTVEALLQHLALEHGKCFTARPLFLEDEAENVIPLPIILFQGTVTVYDLEVLRGEVIAAAARLDLADATLDKALDYYEHALYLMAAGPAPSWLPSTYRTAGHLVAAAFLFLWKALSVVVGDPSIDGDYQKRYRELGLDYVFFRDTIEEIRRLRNEDDVAHYRLDASGLETLKQRFAMAQGAVRRVVIAYAAYLRSRNDNMH
jgi:hypothetical protein